MLPWRKSTEYLCHPVTHVLSSETEYKHVKLSMANGLLLSHSFPLPRRIDRKYSLVSWLYHSCFASVASEFSWTINFCGQKFSWVPWTTKISLHKNFIHGIFIPLKISMSTAYTYMVSVLSEADFVGYLMLAGRRGLRMSLLMYWHVYMMIFGLRVCFLWTACGLAWWLWTA